MAALRTTGLALFGRLHSGHGALLPCASIGTSNRQYADDVKFLKSIDAAHMKRGRGGRSSFSGVVCTVFGATGFIGRSIVNRLGKTGTQMVLPYRCQWYDVRHLKVVGDLGQVLFCPFHLCDEESIAKAVKHSSVVINLIGKDWPTLNFSLQQAHIEGAARVARVCKKMGVERLIHFSMLNCDREHKGSVLPGGSKLLAVKGSGEEAVLSEFPEAIIIRPSDVYGQGDRFLRYFSSWVRRDLRYLALPNGGYGIYKQPVFVGDVTQGVVNAVLKDFGTEGTIYQAVGPRRYELRELVEWFLRVLRRDPDIVDGTTVIDLKYDPLLLIKAKMNESFPAFPSFPYHYLTTDKLERETVTDIVSPVLPTLEDLGVELTKIEDRIDWELRPFRAHEDFEEELGDFAPPAPPKFINP